MRWLVVASPHALLTVSHHMPVRQPFAFTAAYAAPRSSNLHALVHVHTQSCRADKPAPVASHECRTFAIFIAISGSNPIAAISAAALPNSRYAHRSRLKNLMRPTGEASEPISGEFVSRFSKPAFRHPIVAPPPHRASCSGVPGDATVSGRFRCRKLVVSAPYSKRYFSSTRALRFSRGSQSAVFMARKSRRARAGCRPGHHTRAATVNPALVNSALTAASWPVPSSTISRPPGASRPGASRRDGAVSVKPVVAAVERWRRVVVAHLRRERCDVAARNIRRVRHDEVERALQRRRRYRRRRSCSAPARPRRSALARATAKRLGADIGADAGRVGQFAEQRQQQRARAGADIEHAQLLQAQAARRRRHRARPRPPFRFPAAAPARGRDCERETPEFLAAENARDRLVPEPARGERLDRLDLARLERAFALAINCGAVQAERMRRSAAARRSPATRCLPARNFSRQRAPRRGDACAVGRSVTPRLRPPAVRPDAR